MNFEIIVISPFEKEAKRLSKKYKSLKADLQNLFDELSENPIQGSPLGKDCYKIRMAISSKGKGKSGDARVIACVKIVNTKVYMLSVYDKSEKEDISDSELQSLLQFVE
jgi:mRNA-degrading endonuclease RelE of RelBE toxin-antitoxin system